jgi:hypothetical protein
MAKGSIDPAFQAAPFLGESSHDPIEFTRRHNLAKYQQAKQREEQIQKNTAEGLDKLMVDLKGWEDQKGFKEIMDDQDNVLNTFLDLSRKGMNLMSPRTSDEAMMYKAITDAHSKIKQKVDTWNQQKNTYDMARKAIETDAQLPESEQKIDHDASYKNMQDILSTNDIYGRSGKLQNMLVKRVEYGDVIKAVTDNKSFFNQPTETQVVVPNPVTGQNEIKMQSTMEPEKEKENQKRLGIMYEGFDQKYKNTIKKQRENDPDPNLNIMSDKDYFISSFSLPYKEKFIEKTTGTGGGGLNFNFLGTQAKVTPGELHKNDNIYGGRNYNERYDFTATKTFKVPTTGGYQHDSDPNPAKGDDGWHEIKGGDDVEAELRFYDPKTDMLIFRSGQSAQNPWVQNNTTFAVPRKNVPDAEKLPIKIDGKIKQLKDVLPKEETTTPKKLPLPNNFWSKPAKPYIPKSK